MGVYYLLVNPAKREYLDPDRFGEGIKFGALLNGGHCALALKYLISDDCVGWWVGDPVILAADDTGPPNPGGLITATAEKPGRNLYFQAREEFVDISYRAFALIARNHRFADELAERAATNSSFLLELGAMIEQYELKALEIALEQRVGGPWRKAYHQAIGAHPHWAPLPRVDDV
jgi:hypothetical protein